jgi:hypothetical protein
LERMEPEQFERLGGVEKIEARKRMLEARKSMLEARKRAFVGSSLNDIEDTKVE